MKSEIHVSTNSFKLYISIGLCAVLAIAILSWMFQAQISVLLYVVAGGLALAGVVNVGGRALAIWHGKRIADLDYNIRFEEWNQAKAKTRALELSAGFVVLGQGQSALTVGQNGVEVYRPAQMATTQGELPALPAPSIDLLPFLDRAERVLVKGASDAGKTTLLQHIASRSSGVIVVDPHNKPGQWPEHCRIIGDGYNFNEVAGFLAWFVAEIETRYKRRAVGDENYDALTVIVDEFITIREECDDTKRALSKAIRECRKIKIRLFVGSHSELVEPLGLKGASDLRDGLLIVRLDYDQITHERAATVDYGRGERACQFPPHSGHVQSGTPVVIPDLVIPPVAANSEAEKDALFVRLVNDGTTKSDACWQVYKKSFSGPFSQRLNRLLSSSSEA